MNTAVEPPVTADTALRLARFFGTSERFWINLQSRYDLEVERESLDEILAAWRVETPVPEDVERHVEAELERVGFVDRSDVAADLRLRGSGSREFGLVAAPRG